MKRTIIERKVPLIFLTLFFTLALNKIANTILNAIIVSSPSYNPHPLYTYNYSFGLFGMFFAIPAALAGYWIVNRLPQIEYALMHSPTAQKLGVSRSVERLNKVAKICLQAMPGVTRVIAKLSKIIWFVFKWTGYIFVALILWIVSMMGGSKSSSLAGRSINISPPKLNNNKEKEKADAKWKAEQAQKDANVAWKHASAQARYNTNTHHFDERLNRAASKQREADEAAKRARDL